MRDASPGELSLTLAVIYCSRESRAINDEISSRSTFPVPPGAVAVATLFERASDVDAIEVPRINWRFRRTRGKEAAITSGGR